MFFTYPRLWDGKLMLKEKGNLAIVILKTLLLAVPIFFAASSALFIYVLSQMSV
jgi:hypothetical protein